MKRLLLILLVLIPSAAFSAGRGYYRYPAIHGETIIFTAEGDLWKVTLSGGTARRLTTHHGMESYAAISPDGQSVAFCGQYEGPREVYTLPINGGVPIRRTWESGATVTGWTPDGRIAYTTNRYSTLPNTQMILLNISDGTKEMLPLAQISDGAWKGSSEDLFFTRLPFQGSQTKRYKGGTIQHLWKFPPGATEAIPLTEDFAGTSKDPMWWKDRLYFLSDRDGTMNLWSMNEDGGDIRQHTFHKGLDAANPSIHDGKIAYQLIADIHVYDIASDIDRNIPIELASDFDQMREKWVTDPSKYITAVNISHDGSRVALTARGQAFTAPVKEGRFVRVTRKDGVRYRGATFMPDGKTLLALSDESGELEFLTLPADGTGEETRLTDDGKVLRYRGIPSPDGKHIAYTDKNYMLWILDVDKKSSRKIDESGYNNFSGLAWSPDSRYLAFDARAKNHFNIIKIYDTEKKRSVTITGERFDSYNAAWSHDGKWLYFISDRTFKSLVSSPWGLRNPSPFFDKMTKIYMMSLVPGERSPFIPDDEVYLAEKKETEEKKKQASEKSKDKDDKDSKKGKDDDPVSIEFEGIRSRVYEVPVPAGNYSGLETSEDILFFSDRKIRDVGSRSLKALKITNSDIEIKTVMEKVSSWKLSGDSKKILVRKNGGIYVIDAGTSGPSNLGKEKVDLGGWAFTIDPKQEWRQMFAEAWRLERDYFYDPDMHGVDYDRLFKKYLPYVDRVTDRYELSDLISHLVGELSTLHTFVARGDLRTSPVNIRQGTLGALLEKDEKNKGYRITHIYKADPDILNIVSPLAGAGSRISEGDVITAIDGVELDTIEDWSLPLGNTAGKQVLLSLRSKDGNEYRAIVTPISTRAEFNLRYSQWENERREIVEEKSSGDIGYVHLRAMGPENIAEWTRDYYPSFDRKGLIIDVRHNRGGSIDSWILEKLLRRAWFYWKPRVGEPFWNMQYAFRGHLVVLCNESTASDGEALAEGFRRLGLGKVIGTRTWGGEVWLSFSNWLVDGGIASAAELGVYGPEGDWLIEGHGVDPDIVVDNLPHATFKGADHQLEAAIAHLRELIKKDPVEVPPVPDYPDKSFKY